MIIKNALEHPDGLVDQATASANLAIRSTQRVANDALDSLSATVQGLRDGAAPVLNRNGEQIAALAQRGVDAVRDSSQLLREKALRASDTTVGYIRDEPVKSVLIAAAVGAAIAALLGLMSRSRERA